MRLWFVLGTAAELIKVQPVLRRAGERGLDWRVVATGQNGRSFVEQYSDFGLDPERLTFWVSEGKDLATSWQAWKWFWRGVLTSQGRLRQILPVTTQDWIVVHGDTLSTLMGALCARRLGAKLAHIEAGLRSPHCLSPFPEEIVRRGVSRLAALHFAPSAAAVENLRRSGCRGEFVNTQGNTLRDLVLQVAASLRQEKDDLVKRGGEAVPRYSVIANLHRFENLSSSRRLAILLRTVLRVAKTHSVLMILADTTRAKLEIRDRFEELRRAGVAFQSRLPFSKFIRLLAQADFVLTDGGSNQEECAYLGVPCLILRETTERPEGLGENACLSELDPRSIDAFLSSPQRFRRAIAEFPAPGPSQIIIDHLARMSDVSLA